MSSLKRSLTSVSLRLAAVCGEMYQTKARVDLLRKAKNIAKEGATLLKMPEASGEVNTHGPVTKEKLQQYTISQGRLAKVCEALDHLEDYPYRNNAEQSIREILNL